MATPIEQLELMKKLEENFDGYGGIPPGERVLEMAKEFVRLLDRVRAKPLPFEGIFVTPGPDESVLIEWEDDDYHHEMDVNPDGSLSILHEERANGVMTVHRFEPGQYSVAPGLLTHLCNSVLA